MTFLKAKSWEKKIKIVQFTLIRLWIFANSGKN